MTAIDNFLEFFATVRQRLPESSRRWPQDESLHTVRSSREVSCDFLRRVVPACQTDCYLWGWLAGWRFQRAAYSVDSVEFRGLSRRQQIELVDRFFSAQMALESAVMRQVD